MIQRTGIRSMTRDQKTPPAAWCIAWTLSLFMATPLDAQDSASQPSQAAEKQPRSADALRVRVPTQIRIDSPSDSGAFLIDADNTTIDLRGSTIIGADDATPADQYVGRAIVIRKAKNVTLKNVSIRGFKLAIYAEDAPGLRLENCDVSNNYRMRLKSTPQREHRDDWLWPHKNDANEWLRYGAGIYLLRCDDAKIANCRARNGQNGICLSKCNGVDVTENDMSFMSGWGLALYRTNRSRVLGNRFDYCVRGYSHGVYNRGQDSAGILVFEQCSDNLFAYNIATHGGDGFFLYAGDETLKETGKGGCNRNVLYKNDFSYAVMHGIEATFSDQNAFISNKLAHCENGIWAGYSSRTLIEDNQFDHCKTGISIEHGRENLIRWNRISDCARGIHLWWDDDQALFAFPFCGPARCPSVREQVIRNLVSTCTIGLLATGATELDVAGNAFRESERALVATENTTFTRLEANAIHQGKIQVTTTQPVVGRRNWLAPDVSSTGPIEWTNAASSDEDAWNTIEVDRTDSATRPFAWHHAAQTGIPAAAGAPPAAPRHRPREPLPGSQPGRELIIVDEWGPYDFSDDRITPSRINGWGSVQFTLLTPREKVAAPRITGDVVIDWKPKYAGAFGPQPTAAGARTVRPKPDRAGLVPFRIEYEIDKAQLVVSGLLIASPWRIDYFKWDAATDPLKGDDNWKKIIAAPPLKSDTVDSIDFAWGSAAPAPEVPPDHFALVASTRLDLPGGKYRLRSVSDDGVRVYFDGKRVIDNWTWHVPTEDTAIVDATAGPHDIRVEYFEITGHAQLQFFLEPLGGR